MPQSTTMQTGPTAWAGVPLTSQPWAVLDVETTGLALSEARIVEVAIVHLDGCGPPTWTAHTLVDPGEPIVNTAQHGITDDDVRGAPRFADLAGWLFSALNGRIVVGHNVAFDHGVLTAEFARLGIDPPDWPLLCTMRMARDLDLDLAHARLSALQTLLRLPAGLAHAALPDALTAAAVGRSLLALYPLRHVAICTAADGGPPPVPRGSGHAARAARRPRPPAPAAAASPHVQPRRGLRAADLTHLPQRADPETLAGLARSCAQARAAAAQAVPCPRCTEGRLGARLRSDGTPFLGCSRFPACRFRQDR